MNMSDPISDLLARLRNALRAGHEKTETPDSKLRESVLKVLSAEGYIGSVKKVGDAGVTRLQIRLKYDAEGAPVVVGLRRVSRPGRRVYKKSTEIAPVLGGLGSSIVSTSRGIMTDRQAREDRLGGEVLFNVW
jgi:small subunit ribosomal protein S8